MNFKKLRFKFLQNSFFILFLRVSLALIMAFAVNQLNFESWESWTYDLRVRTSPVTEPSGHIKTIEVDARAIVDLKGEPDLSMHIDLLKRLYLAKPKAVIYILDIKKIRGSDEEFQEFATIAKKIPHFILTTKEYKVKGQEDDLILSGPLEGLTLEMALLTDDDNNFARDGVTRRLLLSNYEAPFFHHKIAKEYNGIENVRDYQGAFTYLTSIQTYIDFRPTGTYVPERFTDVLDFDSNQLQRFKNKIVLIGNNTLVDDQDYKTTPYSREVTAMTDLEVHANILDTLILNTSPIQPKKWFTYLLTALISIIIVFTVFSLRPLRGLFILISTTATFMVFVYLSFVFLDQIVDVTHVLLSIFLSYYFFIPYRLIMENKSSWEYQQKNRILKEVEELKTNFMRMMSHDLKTPLARIQGMTEVALSDPTPMSGEQKEALNNINSSSHELSEFISSILDLSRVESNEVKLHLKSKDINSILSHIVGKFEYLAKAKNINLKVELEPLFSIKVDEDLIKQVFTNLVENAIKYSPEGSSVLITTEEIEGRIVIQVADQGQGISEEDQKNIFQKFYRSKEAQTSAVKGSGLGLYLSKYFVELHKGQINVESEVSQGSTFTVELPMEING